MVADGHELFMSIRLMFISVMVFDLDSLPSFDRWTEIILIIRFNFIFQACTYIHRYRIKSYPIFKIKSFCIQA